MQYKIFKIPICLILVLTAGCKGETDNDTRFRLLNSSTTGVYFNNRLEVTDEFNVIDFDYIYNGGGVAVGDFNKDGLPDIFFTGNMVSSRLYINEGDLKFRDVTDIAGVTTGTWAEGVTLVDINNDGLLDIYVSVSNLDPSNPNPNLLFVNQGINEDGIPYFVEMAEKYGIDDRGYNTQAVFFDYDLDGDLDLYILSNALESFQRNTSRPKEVRGQGRSNDKLYRNNGDGTFTNVTRETGILIEGYGLGVAVSDINKDGWPDIYVANDFITNDILYINNGDGTFTNKIVRMMDHQSFNAMGVDVADYNNDGWADVVVLDMFPPDNLRQKTMFAPTENYDLYMANLDKGYEPQYVRNTLQLNNGNGSFSEIGQLAGISQTDWSWAPLFADLDNDGYKDLFVSNGYGKDITDLDYINFSQNLGPFSTPENRRKIRLEGMDALKEVKLRNFIFQNNRDLTFLDVSQDWGMTHSSISNGVAYADLDNDGDLDLVVNNLNEEAYIYRNTTMEMAKNTGQPSNYIQFRIFGDSLNLQGIGVKLTLKYQKDGREHIQYYEHYPSRGYKSHMTENPHFGLGEVEIIRELEVIWPNGQSQTIQNLEANQTHDLYANQSIWKEKEMEMEKVPYLDEISSGLGISHIHQHLPYKDFNRQRLLPHKHSENGPGLAVGDVNGDGLEDFFIGGSAGYSGKIFLQHGDKKFAGYELGEDTDSDDMGCLLVDIDMDGDLDLYIVSGGSRYTEGAKEYQDRLYINDGEGNFSLAPDLLPEMNFSGSVVTAADFDGDGYLDLFVGGRVRPGNYPLAPASAILKNENGKLINVTQEVCPELQEIGMVTSALWTDFDQDGKVDLILVGEWMPVKFFRQSLSPEGKIIFQDVSGEFAPENSNGWWNSILSGDFDQDGSLEYVLGNLGLNSRWKASAKEPLSMYAKDFDQNGSIDPIMFQYLQGEKYAVPGRDALISQIPSWRNRFLVYSDYAKTRFEDFFQPYQEDMLELKAFRLQTSFLKKQENNRFIFQDLPIEVQFSPLYGMHLEDLDGDGISDLLMIGNFYGNETISGRYDALKGLQLKGEENGTFSPVPVKDSGFKVNGEGRSLAMLMGSENQPLFLAAQHADSLRVFTLNRKPNSRQTIPLGPLDFKAIIQLDNGRETVREFYFGSGYLSQSSRYFVIEDNFVKVEILDYTGNSKMVFER